MALYDYAGANRQAKKWYQEYVSRGEYPYLPVLDDILANTEIVSEVDLGIVEIPLSRVVGTRTRGRTQAFAGNFMPLLPDNTEFADKWSAVYTYQVEEGILDPVKVYEFMNRYYVQEGNKRVSVLKYLHAYSISATVTRLIPKKTRDHDIRLYYEFLDFYQVSYNSDIWFSREGSYARMLSAMEKKPGEAWEPEEQKLFAAVLGQFMRVFSREDAGGLTMNASDAFLVYVEIFGYSHVKTQTEKQMARDLAGLWQELELKDKGGEIRRVEQPEPPKEGAGLFNWLLPGAAISPEMFRLGFLYSKTRETSSWCYGHDLGRMHMERQFPGTKTFVYNNVARTEDVEPALEQALADGCNLIFMVAPQMAPPSVRLAIEHPEVKFFCCSVNLAYSSIDTYFARSYEAKFLMGALAAAVSGADHLGYIADFPIYGMLANINAFAIGAGMINPRVKVHVKWSGLKDRDPSEELLAEGIRYIAGDDMITPARPSREYGLFHVREDGSVENLAASLTDWGKFYERLVQQACRSAGKRRSQPKGGGEPRSTNYWWGMSADVVDFVSSATLPIGTERLINFMKNGIKSGGFHPFYGKVYTRDGLVVGAPDRALTAQEIIRAGWFCTNVAGVIPPIEAFKDEVQPAIRLQGIRPSETADWRKNL